MLMAAATRRASCRSSSVQQRPNVVCPSRWSYSCIDKPMTSWPCSASSAAATDESTPPDMATTIRMFLLYRYGCASRSHEGHEGHEEKTATEPQRKPIPPEFTQNLLSSRREARAAFDGRPAMQAG